MFTGCSTGSGDGVNNDQLNNDLLGRWESSGVWGSDGYIVETNRISYFYDEETMFAGTIKHVENFSVSAGVIIIEYDPEYSQPLGNFIGIYYKNLNPHVSVQMGTAWMDGGAEKPTLNTAINAFTLGNEGAYMSFYGLYLTD